MVAPSGEQFEIALGDQRVIVTEVGGALRSYSAGGHAVLDGFEVHEVATSGRGQVLIPWPNRLEDGSYEFDGGRHQLPLDEPERRNAIHGLVRWATWTPAEHEPSRVVMNHTLQPRPGYPFRLEVSVEYALGEDGLTVRTSATNVGASPCPFGSGAHPYFTVGTASIDSATLRIPAGRVFRTDERGLPVGDEPVDETPYDFRVAREIGDVVLDHTFGELARDPDGRARIALAGPYLKRAVVVWADEAYRYLTIFTGDPLPDVARRSLAVEPLTCPPNAFRTGRGLLRLEPGESFSGSWGIAPSSSLWDADAAAESET